MKNMKKTLSLVVLLIFLVSTVAFAADPAVNTFAGSGESKFADGKLVEASFLVPYGMAVDKDGNILVADSFNNKIRKISGDTVATIAGFSDAKDSYGFPAGGYLDGADLLKAEFDRPRDLVIDSKGNIFITDTGNFVIRKITIDKNSVFTFAGTTKEGYLDGACNTAMFGTLSGIAIDSSDNLYVADSGNNVIRKITTDGTVSTFAGKYDITGSFKDGAVAEAMFNEPADLAFGKNGSLYVLDSGNQLIREIKDGQVTTVCGGRDAIMEGTNYSKGSFADGSARNARFNFPKGICIAVDGTIFVADTWNQRIRAVKTDGSVITIAGTGKAGKIESPVSEAELNGPVSVLYDKGKLYIADMWNNSIRVMDVDTTKLQPLVAENLKGIAFNPVKAKDNTKIWIDKKLVVFKEAQPAILNGSTVVSLKDMCKGWGATLKIDKKAGQVVITKGSYTKSLAIDNNKIYIKDGKTMIYLKYFVDSLGLSFDWVPEYKAAVITSN